MFYYKTSFVTISKTKLELVFLFNLHNLKRCFISKI